MKAPILKGGKVILKPLHISQAENYLRWLKDEEINRFLSPDFSRLNLKKEKEYIEESIRNKSVMQWAIYTKVGRHIGNTGLHDVDRKKNLKATWGICIGDKKYWGQGLGTDTLRAILKFAFNKLKLNRIELGVFTFNKRGIRCYEKCGFKKEGLHRQTVFKDGKFIDVIIMSILKSDYRKLRNK